LAAPTDETLRAVLHNIITRTKKLLTRQGVLVEQQRQTYVADNDSDSTEACALKPLQAAMPIAWSRRPLDAREH
jgi:hypothetical protein